MVGLMDLRNVIQERELSGTYTLQCQGDLSTSGCEWLFRASELRLAVPGFTLTPFDRACNIGPFRLETRSPCLASTGLSTYHFRVDRAKLSFRGVYQLHRYIRTSPKGEADLRRSRRLRPITSES